MPLSYGDSYYLTGKRSRGHRFFNDEQGNDKIYFGLPREVQNEAPEEEFLEEAKRGSFRLKKIPEDAIHRPDPGVKRASFRLKRILDNYRGLLGSPSGAFKAI